jgi:hypothetical protein
MGYDWRYAVQCGSARTVLMLCVSCLVHTSVSDAICQTQLIKHHPILSCCFLRDGEYEHWGQTCRFGTFLYGLVVVYHVMKYDNSPMMQNEDDWMTRAILHRVYFHIYELVGGKKAYVSSSQAHVTHNPQTYVRTSCHVDIRVTTRAGLV